jgi:hypothetical protein
MKWFIEAQDRSSSLCVDFYLHIKPVEAFMGLSYKFKYFKIKVHYIIVV